MGLLAPSPLFNFRSGSAPDEAPSASTQWRDRYVVDVVARLKYLQLWIDDPDYALQVDPDVYNKIEREIAIEGPRIFRRHKVAGTEKSVHVEPDPSDPRSAALVPYFNALLAKLERFDTARYNLADSFFKGLTVGLISGDWFETRLPCDTKTRRWWFPLEIRDVDKQRLRQEFDPTTKIERWIIFDFRRNEYVQITPESSWHYIFHRYDTTERSLNYGAGVAARLVFYWTVKTIAFETFVRGAERWGYGWVTAKLKNLVGGATSGDLSTYRAKVNELIDSLTKQRENHIFVHDMDHVELDLQEPSGTGGEILEKIVRYCDEQIRMFMLGALLPTGGGADVGSNARADTESDSQEVLLGYDQSILAQTLTRSLFGAVRRCNDGNFRDLGFGPIHNPRFGLRSEKAPDFKAGTERVTAMLDRGVPLKRSEAYEISGFTEPDLNDPKDVLRGPAAAPSPIAAPPTGGPFAPRPPAPGQFAAGRMAARRPRAGIARFAAELRAEAEAIRNLAARLRTPAA